MERIRTHEDGCGLTELCEVHVGDAPHPVNGAHHQYLLLRKLTADEKTRIYGEGHMTDSDVLETVGTIQFQRGPRNVADSTPGTLDGAVLAVVIHRYECFQAGPFACAENEEVLAHLRAAQQLIIQRAQERAARGVLGRNIK